MGKMHPLHFSVDGKVENHLFCDAVREKRATADLPWVSHMAYFFCSYFGASQVGEKL
jgi:hypothetical protein